MRELNAETRNNLINSMGNGGRGWIRTNVGVRQRIYSPPPLATRAPFRRRRDYRDPWGDVNEALRGLQSFGEHQLSWPAQALCWAYETSQQFPQRRPWPRWRGLRQDALSPGRTPPFHAAPARHQAGAARAGR